MTVAITGRRTAFVSRLLTKEGLGWCIEEDDKAPAGHRLRIFADSQSFPEDALSEHANGGQGTFLTIGSTNINTRSMQVDSELNVTHHRPEVTGPIRQRLWGDHTQGQSGQEPMGQEGMAAAYEKWGKIMTRNTDNKGKNKVPIARLAAFLRTNPDRSNKD
ncbi:hypothetical protein [Quatrionicoccus australiensis]|uniref:hypothetical protein n=1 Tax=Quatrionicoccus australiensis TaxID=138118 RepID=UPI001CFBE225|nr:hypothetical protein [Quatrionicoccus australiensis]MCB4359526.1 hypothetical protein [Quatrionicoccus australiensis]